MRKVALSLLLLTASCGRNDPANQAGAVPGVGGPEAGTRTASASAPAIAIAATGPGGCEARWEGQIVTPAQIKERSIALLEQAIEAIGGRQNITMDNLPVPSVEAPADLGFACADPILFALQDAGMFSLRIRPTGGQAPVPLDLPFDTNAPPPPIPTVLGIGAGGRMTWNGDPLDAAGLATQLGRIGSTTPPEPGEMEAPPGGLEVRVAREATFGQVYELLRTTRRYHLRPFVYLPSAEAGPAAGAPPSAPPAGPPAVPPVPPPPPPPR